jgi:ATP-binding cassette subfamily F protein uup
MDRLGGHLLLIDGGTVRGFPGEYRDYIEFIEQAGHSSDSSAKTPVISPEKKKNEDQKKRKPSFKEQKEYEALEKEIEALEIEKKTIETSLSEKPYHPVETPLLEKRHEAILSLLEVKIARWEELAILVMS